MFYRFAEGLTSSRRIILDDVEVEVFGAANGCSIRSRVEWHSVNMLLGGNGISNEIIADHLPPEIHIRPAGSLYFIPSCSHVQIRSFGESATYVTTRISPTVFYKVAQESGAGTVLPARVVQPFFDAEMAQVVRGMVEAAESTTKEAIDVINARAGALAVLLLRRLTGDHDRMVVSGGLSSSRRLRVVDLVRARLSEQITLEEMADAAGLSVDRFRHAFKATFGVSPHRYLMTQRVKLAQELLTASDDPLADIALASGFGSQAHFTTVFRDFVGVTPGAYRKARRG